MAMAMDTLLSRALQRITNGLRDVPGGAWSPMQLTSAKDSVDAALELETLRQDPRIFLRKTLGVARTWTGQDRIMAAVPKNQRVAVRSGHALGKDFLSARLILWFLYSHAPSIVIATAPTERQVHKIIWGELEDAYHHSTVKLPGRLMAKELIVDETRKWYALGFTTKDAHHSPGKFQGFHSENTLVIFSEAQAIERTIWEQAESLRTSGNARWIAIGNPLVSHGAFYEACQPNSGWHTITLDCEDSPNVVHDREIIPGLVSRQWVDDMAKKYGRQSPTYISKVKGRHPNKSTDAFVQAEWLEWAAEKGPLAIPAVGGKVLGVDCAGTGRNKTVLTMRHGMKVVEVKKVRHSESGHRPSTETRDLIIEAIMGGVARVYLDVGGLGGGVYDQLIERGYGDKVVPVNFGGRPKDNEEELERDPLRQNLLNKERYANLGSQLWGRFAHLLEHKRVAVGYDEDLQIQLLNRKMLTMPNGKRMLEPKDEFTARGFDSPDEADSIALCFADVEPAVTVTQGYVQEVDDETIASIWER